MASRQPRNSQGGPPTPSATTRQNEYFVPRDGIDREVISADICRYLGNDALVRPGHYEDPQTGQVVQGYYITAYRNLTTAMIEDLKADSARWDSERRAQTSRSTPGGTNLSREGQGGFQRPPSDSQHAVQYRYSETHQSRQHHGPTEPPYQADPYARDASYDGPRYPGAGAAGYTGASGNYPQQPTYAPTSGGGSSYGAYPPPQQPGSAPPHNAQYGPGQPHTPGYQPSQDAPYISTGANMARAYGAGSAEAYPPNRMMTSMPPQGSSYATSGPPQTGYSSTSPSPYQYPGQGHPPPGSGGQQGYSNMPPSQDPYYGRASPAGQQGHRPPVHADRHSRPPPPR